jgi:hypothetical protein
MKDDSKKDLKGTELVDVYLIIIILLRRIGYDLIHLFFGFHVLPLMTDHAFSKRATIAQSV